MKDIRKTEIFNSLNDTEIEQVLKKVHFRKKTFAKGEMIIQSGAVCESLKIILSGSAHTEMNNLGDKVIKIADILTGQVIAISFVFGDNNKVPVDVIANEKTEMLIFPKESVKQILSNGKVLDAFLRTLSNQTQYLARKIKFLNFNTITEKIIFYLKEQQSFQNSKIIELNITQQKLAELFGVTRPSLARAIKKLENEKIIINLPNKKIKLL